MGSACGREQCSAQFHIGFENTVYYLHENNIKKMLRENSGKSGRILNILYGLGTLKQKQADWKTTSDVKNDYRNASFVGNNRVIFNIKGNKYRLVVIINYQHKIVYIRFVGTHNEYDKIDASTI